MATNFELSYGGHPFYIPSAELLGKVTEWLRIEDMRECQGQNPIASGRSAARLNLPEPQIPSWVGMYKLYMPSTACKFGVFRGLTSKAQADLMIASEVASGMYVYSNYVSHTLVMKLNADATPIKARMLMLPPRPLTGLDGASDLYLVTLVDERFFWNWHYSLNGTVSDSPDSFGFDETWAEFFEFLPNNENALDTILFQSAVEAVYGQPEPDSDLYSFCDNASALIDAGMSNVGRVVSPRLTDGILCIPAAQGRPFSAVRWDEAYTHLQTVKTALAPERLAGNAAWGEAGLDAMRARVLPSSVVVFYPCWRDGTGYETGTSGQLYPTQDADRRSWSGGSGMTVAYVSEKTAAGLGSPYSLMATTPNTHFFIRDTARALNCDNNGVPENSAELSLLSTRLAKDFYDHQLLSTDICYRGLVQAWSAPHGLDVVWDYLGGTTRIVGMGPHRHQTEMQHSFGWAEAPRYNTSVSTVHPEGAAVLVNHGALPETISGAAEDLLTITIAPGAYLIELDSGFSLSGSFQSYWTLFSGTCYGVPVASKTHTISGATSTVADHWSFVAMAQNESVIKFSALNGSGSTTYDYGYPKITSLK